MPFCRFSCFLPILLLFPFCWFSSSSPSPFPVPSPILSAVPFNCQRIHPSFCCSGRVRQNCANLCSSSSPSCPNQGSIQPPQLPSPTSFGGSIDQPNFNVPAGGTNVFGGFPPFGPSFPQPPIFPPSPAAGQNVAQRRFTTEGERQSGQWKGPFGPTDRLPPFVPSLPMGPTPLPHFPPPPSPPTGLILPPPETPTAQGTPIPIEDLDMIEELGNGGGNGRETKEMIEKAGGQTEVEAAEETPTESDSRPTFATLIPPNLQPSIDASATEEPAKVMKTQGGAIDGMASATSKQQTGKRRSGGGGSALTPPHLMSELEELEGKSLEQEERERPKWWATMAEGTENLEPHRPRTTVTESDSGMLGVTPRNFGEFAPPTNPGKLWTFRIKPSENDRQKEGEEGGEGKRASQHGLTGQSEMINDNNPHQGGGALFGGGAGERIEVFVDKIFNKELLSSIAAITNRNNSAARVASNYTPPPSSSSFPPSTSTSSPSCGIPPQFIPCLPLDQANVRLQSCCQKRQMPAGCLPLCRYDTTQSEVKMAFDKGQCGILNVTPFLECASQGQNNLKCCQQREVAKNSGIQCEIFCTGEKLGLLGLQHLVCSTQIQTFLQCHHSGLKF